MRLKQSGFSVVELMIVLVIAGVLLSVAVPSFKTLTANNRLYTQANDLYLSLMRARNEAMTRVQRVTVCASTDGATCTGNWDQGWIIFAEALDPNSADEVIHIQQQLSGNTTLRGDTQLASYVSYTGSGFTQLADGSGAAQTGTFILCDDRGLSSGKAIKINAMGRPRVMSASSLGACDPNTP